MKLIEIDKLEFIGGTYDDYHVGIYSTFIFNDKMVKISTEFVVDIIQGDDSIVFIEILGRDVEEHFIVEDMQFLFNYVSNITKIINIYNNKVKRKHRNKQINNITK